MLHRSESTGQQFEEDLQTVLGFEYRGPADYQGKQVYVNIPFEEYTAEMRKARILSAEGGRMSQEKQRAARNYMKITTERKRKRKA